MNLFHTKTLKNVKKNLYWFAFKSGRFGRLLNPSKVNSNSNKKLFDIDSKPVLTILATRDIKQAE